jgi:ABC-type uncharacterized transport system auxiliary subunit
MKKFLLPLLLIISACSVGDHPEIATYTVNKVIAEPGQCKGKINLQISEPSVAPGLDSVRVAVLQGSARINYYAGIKWAAPVSEMVQSVLVDSFNRNAAFASVNTEAQTIHNDMTLITDIRNYEVTDQASGKIRVRMLAKLVNSKDRKVLATIPAEKEVTPDSLSTDNIMAAFNQATAEIAAEIASNSAAALPHCKPGK